MASLKRAMAAIRLARTNRLFLSESECHTLSTITTIRGMKYNFRDKYLKEYRVKNTNISILKKAK